MSSKSGLLLLPILFPLDFECFKVLTILTLEREHESRFKVP